MLEVGAEDGAPGSEVACRHLLKQLSFALLLKFVLSDRCASLAHEAILRAASRKRFEILRVPGVVQLLHVLQILASIHSPPHEMFISQLKCLCPTA
jgi:hypothetical protein